MSAFIAIDTYAEEEDCFKSFKTFEELDTSCIRSSRYEKKLARAKKVFEKRRVDLAEAKKELEGVIDNKEKDPIQKKIIAAKAKLDVFFRLDSKEKIKELKGKVYFYQTGAGFYGKMIIRNVTATKVRCLMYVDTFTYE
mgnify:CR=1 FL=1